jgi:hypothetical protein
MPSNARNYPHILIYDTLKLFLKLGDISIGKSDLYEANCVVPNTGVASKHSTGYDDDDASHINNITTVTEINILTYYKL